jgi:hypothetical protein
MNPDYSLADWVSNRGILIDLVVATYKWREIGVKVTASAKVTQARRL